MRFLAALNLRRLRGLGLAMLIPALSSTVSAADAPKPKQGFWTIERRDPLSEIEVDPDKGIAVARGGVVIRYEDASSGRKATLTAEQASLDQDRGEADAQGAVVIQSAGQVWRGERLLYNFKTGQIRGEEFRTGKSPFFAAGSSLRADRSNNVYSATGAYVTGDDVAKPGYRVRARELILIPGESIEARDAVLLLGNTPVMYLPYFHRRFARHPNNFEFTPGYRSLYGPYLLGTYNWFQSDALSGAVHLDYRQKRGVGGGPEFSYDLGNFGRGFAEFYYANDDSPGVDLVGNAIRDDRHRASFWHTLELGTNFTAKAVVREQSDAQVIRDFFESEYRRNTQASSFLEATRTWSNFSLDAMAQVQVNEFFETVERLPDVKLTGLRQKLGVLPLYYETESSIGYFRRRFADNQTNDYAAWRGDSYHQIVAPKTLFGWLNVTPRVGGRFTHYGETEGANSSLLSQDRWVFNTGGEVSWKASRVWRGVKNGFFEVDGLRHILQPSVNYVYVPSPDKAPRQLPQFDSELPTLRLLPIEYPDYNAIDSVDSQNVVRFALRNKVQTRRKERGSDNLVNWALYTDWRLHPRPGQSTFADFFSDLDFKPRSWLTFNSEVRYDLSTERWREANHTATILPGDRWSWTLGHRYLRDGLSTYGLGNNLILSSYYYRLNHNWAVRLSHHFEARDGTMEEQYYTLYRDFRSWTGGLTLRLRDSRGERPEDVTVAVTFSLKAFPRYKVGKDRDEPSLLLGL